MVTFLFSCWPHIPDHPIQRACLPLYPPPPEDAEDAPADTLTPLYHVGISWVYILFQRAPTGMVKQLGAPIIFPISHGFPEYFFGLRGLHGENLACLRGGTVDGRNPANQVVDTWRIIPVDVSG